MVERSIGFFAGQEPPATALPERAKMAKTMGLLDRFKKKPAEPDRPAAPIPSAAPGEGAELVDQPPQAADQPAHAVDQPTESAGETGGLLARFRQGLKKTSQLLNTDIRDLFKKEGQLLDDEFLDRLFALLVHTDMGAGPASEIRDEIQHQFRGRVVHMADLLAQIRVKLNQLTAQVQNPIALAPAGPTVIMVVGVNGSGKTTSIAKLAYAWIAQGKKVVLGAGDTFRAAAVEQLSIWAERVGAEIVTGASGSDPASVAHRAVFRALETGRTSASWTRRAGCRRRSI